MDVPAPGDTAGAHRIPASPPWSVRARNAVLALLPAVLVTLGSLNSQPLVLHGGSALGARCLAVGAAASPDKGKPDALTFFRSVEDQIGPLTVRRSYDRTLPATFATSSARRDIAAGLLPFVSWKPPHGDHRGAAAGKYDRQITAWAKSVPRVGVYATAFHEPENDMSAAEFVAFERHVYTVVKAANSTIQFGPVYMAYWWDPGQPQHYIGAPAAWWPGTRYADFVGLDWYGADPHPMTQTPEFANWYRAMAPTGLPLMIPEYGQYLRPPGQALDPSQERARAQAITADATWLLAHRQFRAWLYWDSGDRAGDWRLRDRASQLAWRSAALRGCAR
jgi:hypothetical protein